MEESQEKLNQEHSQEQHNHDYSATRPSKKYKWFFTILFIPLCLFATSQHIASQISERGEAYLESGIYADAARQYRKVGFLSKNDLQSWNYLGYSYRMMGDYGKAAGVYNKILKLDPQNLGATNDLAMSYAMKEDYEDAIRIFRKLDEMILTTDRLKPEEKMKHREKTISLLATCYEKMGNLDEARSVVQEYLKADPDSLVMKQKLMQMGNGKGVK